MNESPQSSQSPVGGGLGEREMLEAAAKAAGLELKWGESHIVGDSEIDCTDLAETDEGPWNPLWDDGDALRLAAHLRLKVLPGKHKGDGCTVEPQRPGIAGCTAFRDDPAEQMRFAIVFVAAGIGAAMASERGAGG